MNRLKTMIKNFIRDRALMVRTTVLFYLMANQFLIALDYNTLPFDEQQVTEGVSMVLTTIAVLWTWWRNTNLSDEAVEAQKVLDEMKFAKTRGYKREDDINE